MIYIILTIIAVLLSTLIMGVANKYTNKKIPAASPKRKPRGNTPVGVDGFEPPTLCL